MESNTTSEGHLSQAQLYQRSFIMGRVTLSTEGCACPAVVNAGLDTGNLMR